MSAGALIVGPDIEPMSIVTDTSLGASLTTTQAAGVVDCVVLPHFDQREAAYREVIARYGGRYKLVPLRDDEAVLIEGTAWRVVPSPSWSGEYGRTPSASGGG
jgi:dipeptidase E